MDLAAERRAAEGRQTKRRREFCARIALNHVGWSAERKEVQAWARARWGLDDEETRAVGAVATRLQREERAGVRHLTLGDIQKEADMADTAEIKKHTERMIREDPNLGKVSQETQMEWHDAIMKATGGKVKFTSWQVGYFYPLRKKVRKELGKPTGKAPEKPKRRQRRKRPEMKKAGPEGVTVPPQGEAPPPSDGPTGRRAGDPWPKGDGPPPEGPYVPPDPVDIEPPELPLRGKDGDPTPAEEVCLDGTEIALLQRLAALEQEEREIQVALRVIARLKAAA